MVIGIVCAGLYGLVATSFVYVLGDAIDAFGSEDPGEVERLMNTVGILFLCVGGASWIFSYFYYGFLMMASHSMIKTIKVKYLEAILR